MGDTDRVHTGRCLCGAVTFQTTGAPRFVGHCHCRSCRRNTGSAVATFVGVLSDQFRYTKGRPKDYGSSPGVTRSFCPDCGTPLTYQAEVYPNEVHIYVSTFDRPEDFSPQLHVFVAEALPWLHIEDDLPRYATTSRDAEPIE